jgi:hypothetical protein
LRKNCSDPNLHVCLTIHERFDGKKQKEEHVGRKFLAGQFKESWKDRALLLADSSPL